MKKSVSILCLMALCVGCNPHLVAPTVDVPERYSYQDGYRVDSLLSCERWWEVFGDTTLNRLITTALSRNYDLQIAASKVLQAQHSARVTRSESLPAFALGREVGITESGKSFTQHYALEPTVSWEIPLFGSLKSANIIAQAEVDYAQWQYEGVRLAMAAQVATLYYTLLQYQRDLNVAVESSRLRGQTALLTDSLFVRGLATGVHRQQAKSLLYTAQADIPLYERQVRQTLTAISELLSDEMVDTVAYKKVDINAISHSPSIDIPIGVPSELLYRRSDIASAYSQMVQSAAKAKMARIARLPTLSLTAEGGVVSSELSGILKGENWGWSALLSFAQPIYRFGALKGAEKAAVESYNQALQNYRQSFIAALMDVENALVAIRTTREQAERYKSLIEANRQIATLSVALYKSGLSSYLEVIDAERSLYDAQMQYSNIIASQYIAYIELFKALGGGM